MTQCCLLTRICNSSSDSHYKGCHAKTAVIKEKKLVNVLDPHVLIKVDEREYDMAGRSHDEFNPSV